MSIHTYTHGVCSIMRAVQLVVGLFVAAATLLGTDAKTTGVSKASLPHRAAPKYPGTESVHPFHLLSASNNCLFVRRLLVKSSTTARLLSFTSRIVHRDQKMRPHTVHLYPSGETFYGITGALISWLTLTLYTSRNPHYPRRTLRFFSRPRT